MVTITHIYDRVKLIHFMKKVGNLMKYKAYPYIRYSSKSQQDGDSEKRQYELAESYAQRHNLEFDNSYNFNDFGVSAYTGDNIDIGSLREFISHVRSGEICSGSYLLFENFDRFSRMEPRKALQPFLELIESGIIIVTLEDEKVYDEKIEIVELLATLISMQRAFEESNRKGKLVSAAKTRAKNDVISGKRKTLWKWGTPKWLDLSEDRSHFLVNTERVSVIKKILEWSIEGFGTSKIIEKLEVENVAPWNSSSGIKKKSPKSWHGSQIARIVNNKALFGDYELKIKDQNGNNTQSVIIQNFFPKIISEKYFYRVQNSRNSRRTHSNDGRLIGSGGRKGKTFSNLFSKLAICGYSIDKNFSGHNCQGNNQLMVYSNKDKKDKNGNKIRQRYLECGFSRVQASRCKKCRKSINYDFFEEAFLLHVKDISVETLIGDKSKISKEVSRLKNDIASLRGKLKQSEQTYKKLEKAIEQSFADHAEVPKLYSKQLITIEGHLEKIPNQIKDIETELSIKKELETNKVEKKFLLNKLISKQKACTSDTELYDLRARISELLKGSIEFIEVYNSGRFVDYDKSLSILSPEDRVEAKKLIKRNEDQLAHNKIRALPIMIIRYISGESRMLILDTKNKETLIGTTLSKGTKLLDYSIPNLDLPQ